MAREITSIKAAKRQTLDVQLDKFDGGVVTLINESKLPANAAKQAKNLLQVEDGSWKPRWGSAYYGTDLGATIGGGGTFTTDAGATHLVVVAGGTVYRSTDDGTTWDECSGGTFTAGNHVKMKQIKSFLFMVSGTDSILRYNGTTTLQTYSGLDQPENMSASETGMTGTDHTFYYAVAAVNDVGSTAVSDEDSEQTNLARDNWATDGSDFIDLSWDPVSGADFYDIYIGFESGSLFYLASTEDTSFRDDGSLAINEFLEAPIDDTTTGPKTADIELSGNRLWMTQDEDNPWRVFWGGTGVYQGRFSPFYGGGWVDLEKGGRERPQSVVHFQDGKGTSFLTVLTKDPEGNGAIWQIALETATVGDTSFTIPAATKLVGSVGTTSYRGVIKVGNTIMFPNQKGIFSLGPRPRLLNLLDTKELTANIRPTYQGVLDSALEDITGYYFDAKVFISVPFASSTNNRIMLYDTERRNWNPQAFDFGVDGMFEYSDTDGNTQLLCWKPSGTRLIRISENIKGDLGSSFETHYISPLIPLTPDRVGFGKVKKAYIELSQPKGNITFIVSGIKKNKSFSALASETIKTGSSASGWSSSPWSSTQWSDSQFSPTVFQEASLVKYIRINKLLANIQFEVKSTSKNDTYILRTLLAKGFIIPTQDPASRKL